MKFKWKYVAWLLPFIILWGSIYFAKNISLYDVWWGFPYATTMIVAGVVSIGLFCYCFTNDK